jgi:delta-aminolevulinic acid dehydratase/porphobilinogen synthase
MFPIQRPRRLRKNETIRRMVRETSLSPDNFVYPLFVTFGKGVRKEISSMPGCCQESVDKIVKHAKEVYSLPYSFSEFRKIKMMSVRAHMMSAALFREQSPPLRMQFPACLL